MFNNYRFFKVALASGVLALGPSAFGADQQPSTGWRQFGTSANDQVADQGGSGPAPAPVPAPAVDPAGQITIPAGTFVSVRVNQRLSSDHNQAGDTFTSTLNQPVIANGLVVARRGQILAGQVAEAQKAGKVQGTSRLGVELTELTLADGQQVPVHTQLMEYSGGTSKGNDAAAIIATTGLGAAIGGAVNGGVGAGIGAVAGAAASTIGVLATRGRSTEIYPEMTLTFRTTEPITFSTVNSAQAFVPANQGDYGNGPDGRPRLARTPPPPTYYDGYYDGYYDPYFYGPRYYGSSVFFYGGGPRVFVGGHFGGHSGGGRHR